MGVPKFYRWISERYPCLSEVIKEYQIPEFDNLYLDMNGIIHVCSHPNDDDPHFRISEEKIFADICHYLDFLFKMIKPRKVFFMAVDGVAPRAKMNQQRGRRFRTARDATLLEQKARESGESLPTEARFDSNCITPGTAFMVRLHETLKNFVVYKISTDKLWQNVRVFLSGHETPGEGEHKIMDFIRYEKSQKNYDPNTRHCLYGLDADLIMLGLCSHEPHFSLLREEVRFGKKANQKRIMTPEETTFHLLHLSLLREYLEYEFAPAKSKINFEFDVEKIIDDFVLMSFLVGNDFIPHLPQLHIHHDALPTLFETYIETLPSLGGYINEGGYLNLERFEMFFKKLAEFDYMKFSEVSDFAPPGSETKPEIYEEVSANSCLEKLVNLGFSEETLSKATEFDSGSDNENNDSLFELEFEQHKRDYYRNKLEFENVDEGVLRDQAEGYVRAIQWNLHYYYNGVPSWSWYYPHHYAPYISDVKDFKNMSLDFELGKPFLPFQQLLAVLPSLSKELLPLAYQKLMVDENSPVIDFYPEDFETDLNGKKQDWEAVVLIPFINEKLLLKCALEADKTLTDEERKRNAHGPHLLYTYTKKATSGITPSFLPEFFPPLESHHAKCQELALDYFRLPPEKLKKGLCSGVRLDVHFPGFPSLKHIPHTAKLGNEDVKVFQMISQRDNMMLTVTDVVPPDLDKVAESMLGKIVHVGWPHLVKASVVEVSDVDTTYTWENSTMVKSETSSDVWKGLVASVNEHHFRRLGIALGEVNILVHAKCLTGSKLLWDEKVMEEIQWTEKASQFPYQTTIQGLEDHYPETKAKKTCKDLFPIGSPVFRLGFPYYGCMGTVSDNDVVKNRGEIIVKFEIPEEPDMTSVIKNKKKFANLSYVPGYTLAQHLGISGYFLSRLTGTLLIQTSPKESISPNKVNVGLNLKFNKKNEEVAGYSKRTEDNQWLYSDQVYETLEKYLSQFPEFFEALVPLTTKDVIYLEDMYPNGGGKEVLKTITTWLKSQQCSSAERQICGLNTLDDGIVFAIEEVVNAVTVTKKVASKNVLVKPQELYNPYLCKGCVIPDSKANFHLFNRVINVSHTLTVPLGRRGTIIGVRTADRLCDYVYEVVFDQEFFGGIQIHCSRGRGYRMPPSALINLTYGDRLFGKPRSPKKRINLDQFKNQVEAHLGANSLSLESVGKPSALSLPHDDNEIVGSPPQIQILRKDGQQSSANPPFYKNDAKATVQQAGSSPFSNFVPQGMKTNESSDKQFVMPKANQAVTRNSLGSSKAMSYPVADKEYDAVWDGLLSKTIERPSPSKNAVEKSANPHGKPLSIKELFSAFETPPAKPPSAPVVQPKRIATMELMTHCTKIFRTPPTYTYNQLAINHWYIATVILPDGKTFMSAQCPNEVDAAENAAEKALVLLKGFISHPMNQNPLPIQKPSEIHLGKFYQPAFANSQNPYQQPMQYRQNFQSEYRMPFPNSNFMPNHPPPLLHHSNGPAIRYPVLTAPIIPESFVKHNQMKLDGHVPLAAVKHFIPDRSIPLILPQDSIKSRSNSKTPEENCLLKSKESDFVPLQVSRNSTKKPPPETNLNLLDSEWPSLYASDNKKVSLAPCLTPVNSPPAETKSLKTGLEQLPREIILGKSSATSDKGANTTVTPTSSTTLVTPTSSTTSITPTPSTTPKSRKPRLAAFIPNLSS